MGCRVEHRMPRRNRVLVEGATYHVYARVTRRERIFADPAEADAWTDAVRDARRRDGFTLLAWCLMPNHFHIMLRTASVPLWRSMRSIQGRFAAGFNRRRRLVGPVWQSRYKSKLVIDDAYLRRLIAYIHLNPVVAGLVTDAADYRYTGHRDLVGKSVARLVDPEETLLFFGETRRAAHRAYRDTIRVVAGELEDGAATSDDGALETLADPALGPSARPGLDALGRSSGHDRPPLSVAAYLVGASRALGVTAGELAGRQQNSALVRLREAIVLVGTEHYGLRLKALADAIGKSAESASRWVTAAARRRRTDARFAALLESLDAAVRKQGRGRAYVQESHE